MAKDGTRRGGNRVGAGRKSAKMPLPILGLNAVSKEISSENDVKFVEKTLKKGGADVELAKRKRGQSDTGISKSKSNSEEDAVKSKSGGTGKGLSKTKEAEKSEKSSCKSDASGGKRGKSSCKSNKVAYDNDVPDLDGADVPPVDEYLRQEQKCGRSLKADFILDQTMLWLREIKCEHIVSRQLVEQYAMSVARWIQTEEMISQYGFLAKHPTTGAAIASPYVKMSQDYMKQVNSTWYQIYQIVRENVGDCLADNSDDPMERLLRLRGG